MDNIYEKYLSDFWQWYLPSLFAVTADHQGTEGLITILGHAQRATSHGHVHVHGHVTVTPPGGLAAADREVTLGVAREATAGVDRQSLPCLC